MHTYSFTNDYSEGAHPAILEILNRTNMVQEMGYGVDALTMEAKSLIRQALAHPDADIHFISGGTQANLIVLAAMLRPHESVISASTGHINVHEAGAIEATGHRISTVEVSDGKLTPDAIRDVLDRHTDEHMVKPKAVFISTWYFPSFRKYWSNGWGNDMVSRSGASHKTVCIQLGWYAHGLHLTGLSQVLSPT